jgi:hypothetical protein
MSDQDLMNIDPAAVPAYIKDAAAAAAANEGAAAGISTGFPPRVKLSSTNFVLVDGNGDEVPYPPAKLVPGPDDNMYLPIVALAAKKKLSKTWYAGAYNKDAYGVAPDCFSNDSERPDPSVPAPQSDTCAMCPNNAWGSATDQDGNATKGKDCADTKQLAALVPGFGVYGFKIPPGSLKNFGLYLKQLTANGIPMDKVKTLVGFDLTVSFPVLIFRFGGYIDEKLIPTLEKLTASPETEEAIGGVTSSGPKQVEAPTEDQVAKDAAAAAAKVASDKAAAAALSAPADDLGLGLDTPPVQEEVKAPAQTAPVQEAATAAGPTDEELMAELGL